MFKIKWIARFEEHHPIDVEDCKLSDLDHVVTFCKGQLLTKQLSYSDDSPEGFLVCDEEDRELRRWMAEPHLPMEVIVPSKETSSLPSRRARSGRPPAPQEAYPG